MIQSAGEGYKNLRQQQTRELDSHFLVPLTGGWPFESAKHGQNFGRELLPAKVELT